MSDVRQMDATADESAESTLVPVDVEFPASESDTTSAPRTADSERGAPRLRAIVCRKADLRVAHPTPRPFLLGVETDRAARPCFIDESDRLRHAYIPGQPGTGKSTLLRNLFLHDLATGTGACLIDPHGGLIDDILGCARLTKEQRDRIIVVDVANREFPVGINLLDTRNETEQDLTVQFFLSLFSDMYLLEHQGPVFRQAALNGLLVLMGGRRTLAEFPLLFSDNDFLKAVLRSDGIDPFARRYFERLWTSTTPFHRSENLAYFTSKFSPFFDDRIMRNVLAQPCGLRFDEIIDDAKVVLISLARGHIGDVNARMLGQIVLHLIRRSAMRRSPREPEPFHVYVDEAHELSGTELREMLTGLRKFGVGMTLANQAPTNFPPSLRRTIMSSVGTFVVLRQGAETADSFDALLQPRFDEPDLIRLPDHHAIVSLSNRSGYVPPQRLRLNPPPRAWSRDQVERIRRASAERYGRPRREVETELLQICKPAEQDE
jgi:DNA helicase HerA-like ATPase